jgi:hypothetical protein
VKAVAGGPDLGRTREGLLVFQLIQVQSYLESHHEPDCRHRVHGGTCSCDVEELWWDIEELINPDMEHA